MDNQLKALSMYALTKQALLCAFSGIAFCAFAPAMHAATYNWISTSDQDITKNTNWDSAITPTQIDTAVFPDDASLADPLLTPGTVSTTFDAFEIDLTGPRQYVIGIVGNNSLPAPTMTIGSFVGPGGGFKTINTTTGQVIAIVDGGILQLINSASADINSDGQIFYVLRSTDPTTPSSLIFNDSTDAGAANISLSDIPGVGSVLTFNDASNALNSITQATNASIINFNDNSTAGNSGLQLSTASSLNFNGASSLGGTQILSDASTVTFDTLNPNSTAEVFMQNLATLVINKNIILNVIGADIDNVDSSSIQLNNSSVTLNSFSVIGSKISGSDGSLVANGFVVLAGTNSYTGGTTVNGTLGIDNIASLPKSTLFYDATVNANAELEFFNVNGTSPNNILLAEPSAQLSVSGGDITFDGFIQGTGRLLIGNDSIGTLSNTQNNYTGGTVIQDTATLKVNSQTLPVAQSPNVSVTLNDSSTLEFDQNSDGTYAGNIDLIDAGTKMLIKGGPLTLSGALTGEGVLALENGTVLLTSHENSYSGGTIVPADSILQGDGRSLQGSIANDGIVVFTEGNSNTFTGSISSTTSDALIEFNGPGRVTFTNDSSGFQGLVEVTSGILAVNGKLGGSVNVRIAGTLAGIGTLTNNVTNEGNIAPGDIIGNTIGNLTIEGNYVQSSSGTYYVEIDGDGNTDLIYVFGNAQIDGTLVVSPLNGVINPDKIYTILHADGDLTGIYLRVISTDSKLIPQLIYSPHDIQLTVVHLFSSIANTHNQRNVATQLQSITNPTPAESAIIDTLTILASSPDTVDEASLALAQMSGEQYTNTMISTTTACRQFIRRLYDPLRTIISTNQCNPCRYTCDPYVCDAGFPVTLWMEIGGGRSFLSHDHNCSGYKMASYAFTLGAQTTVADFWTFGVAGGYEYDRLHYNLGGSGTNNNGLLGFYGLYKTCGYYLLGDFAIDLNHSKVKRPIVIGDLRFNARGSPKSVQETLYFEAGKDFACNCLLMQPFIGLELDIYTSNQIRESGASPLNLVVKKKNHVNAFSRLGMHLSTANACWALSFDFAWQYRLTQLSNHLEERFHDFGNQFKVLGVNIPRNSLDAAANLTVSLGRGWEVYAEASAERWSHACSYTLLGGLKYAW